MYVSKCELYKSFIKLEKTMHTVKNYYNLYADLPFREKLIYDLKPRHFINSLKIFPKRLLLNLKLNKRYYKIPKEINEEYLKYRPTLIKKAEKLEKYLKLPRGIELYYKDESVSPTHSFKLNAALPLIYYAKKGGFKKVICGTGAGQWGLALAYAAKKFGMECKIYMTSDTYEKKKKRVMLMERNGAEVVPIGKNSYSNAKEIALEECLRTKSFYPEIDLELFQSIIGLETELQLKEKNICPDVMISCLGGGSNIIGFIAPFTKKRLEGKNKIKFISIESKNIPKLTKGRYLISKNKFLPSEKKYSLGKDYIIPKNHIMGLRDTSVTKLTSLLYYHKVLIAETCSQEKAINARNIFKKTEGINPAPEATHAISHAIKEALLAKKLNRRKIIIFNLTGKGDLD